MAIRSRRIERNRTIKTGYTRKLHLAFGAMVLLTLAIAWYFYDSTRWFSNDTQNLAKASSVLSDYEDVARHTYGALQDLETAVRLGAPDRVRGVSQRAESVRNALADLRSVQPPDGVSVSPAMDGTMLDELQATTEEIFRTALLVEAALERGQAEVVDEELARLNSQGTVSRFVVLIDQAIAQRQESLVRLRDEAVSLADYIVRLLPVIMLLFVVAAAFVAWRFSRSLSGSLSVLNEAAREFGQGNLQHMVPDFKEWEFQKLGQAFNHMATQLAEKDAQLRESNVRLEAKVDERTRALQSSNEKLALVDEHRRKLLAEISHEFRTPLTVIKGESEIALRGKNQSLDNYREAFRRVIDTADHATGLVEDLLFIVRADAGQPQLRLQPLEVTEIVQGVCEEFGGKARRKDIHIRYRGGVERATLEGDRRRLRQVFAILLDNALRYSLEGGEIEVVTSSDDGRLVVEVRDRGIGLSEEEAEQAFDRFFRGRQAQAHAEHGTGLGLPVAKAIVEVHGGMIELKTREGQGAVATVILPVEGSLRVVA